jgi:hypothetical protein
MSFLGKITAHLFINKFFIESLADKRSFTNFPFLFEIDRYGTILSSISCFAVTDDRGNTLVLYDESTIGDILCI